MITRRTKIQLLVFLAITLLGVSFVGARYARLDRLLLDQAFTVTAHFEQSGGIFEGAEVTYRGVTVGRVGGLELTDDGVDVELDIENAHDRIPADTRALVGNRSAVGEQYVELQPSVDGGPFLREGSEIAEDRTSVPISSTELLQNTHRLVGSVDQQDLRTVVGELGAAFQGTGEHLGRIIDTSNDFIETANANLDLTTALIRDSNVVLRTQESRSSAIRSFARDLALLSDTLVSSDGDLRRVVASGSATATQLRRFLEDNGVDLGQLVNNLVTTGDITIEHLDGVEMVLILYPYVVAGGYVVVDVTEETGLHDAHFGLVLQEEPAVCHEGYESTDRRPPSDRGNRPMNEDARCTEPPTASNARGAQNARRVAPGPGARVVATYDRGDGHVRYGSPADDRASAPGGAPEAYGADSWKWLLVLPLTRGS